MSGRLPHLSGADPASGAQNQRWAEQELVDDEDVDADAGGNQA